MNGHRRSARLQAKRATQRSQERRTASSATLCQVLSPETTPPATTPQSSARTHGKTLSPKVRQAAQRSRERRASSRKRRRENARRPPPGKALADFRSDSEHPHKDIENSKCNCWAQRAMKCWCKENKETPYTCLLYTSPSPRD